MPAEAAALCNSQYSVVAITCGNSWASGIVVNQLGIVLTVAHVLEPQGTPERDGATEPKGWKAPHQHAHIQIGVRSHIGGLVWYSASVAYRFSGALDLAVLHADVPSSALRPAALSCLPAKVGRCVTLVTSVPRTSKSPMTLQSHKIPCHRFCICWQVGYGLFHPDRLDRPLMGKGLVSNVIRSKDGTRDSRDIMLISSAAVHPGEACSHIDDCTSTIVYQIAILQTVYGCVQALLIESIHCTYMSIRCIY